MRVVLQRVSSASVAVDGKILGTIEQGLLLSVGFGAGDEEVNIADMVHKLIHLRVFPNEAGRFHFSVLEVGGGVLAIPQFTLYGDCSKGRRPDFFSALAPERAVVLFDRFVEALKDNDLKRVETGRFGAHMHVESVNDGPVTLLLEK